MKDLDELKRLLAADLPWDHTYDPSVEQGEFRDAHRNWLGDTYGMDERNRNLIVAAVNALPDLIARIEKAEAENDVYHKRDGDISRLAERIERLEAFASIVYGIAEEHIRLCGDNTPPFVRDLFGRARAALKAAK